MARLPWYQRLFLSGILVCVFVSGFSTRPSQAASEEKDKWQEYRSAHFVVITDAGEKKGREIAIRFEQMRNLFGQMLSKNRLNMSVPLTIFAPRSDKLYYQMAPLHSGQPISTPGFFLFGEDRDFIVLNAFEEEPWRAVAHDFAHYLLTYNYPPVQPWFDEGFAEYFSSVRFTDKQYEIGSDPELTLGYEEDLIGNQTAVRNRPRSLTELLNQPIWLSVPDLLTAKHDLTLGAEGTHRTLFYAQSWITMSYLLNKNKLSEMGTYFGLVHVQKMPVEKALLRAFDMSSQQFDEAVKTYYHSLDQLQTDLEASQKAGASANRAQLYQFPAPRSADDVEVTLKPITDPDIRAMLAEVMLRVPERRQKAISDLQAVLALKDKNGQPIKNEIAHRALAWEAMARKDWDNAADELGTASALNPTDTWLRYYLSLMKYKQAAANHQEIQGLANMMTDLKIALDWYPEFAEGFNMLAVARLQGGGANSALDAIKPAMALSPRNEQYVYNLGLIYVALKRWDPAQNTFERLTESSNPKIAEAARAQLKDFANLKKYGISGTDAPKRTYQSSPFDELAQEAERREQAQHQSGLDKRATQFLRGRLVSVDCSQAPSATLSVSNGSKTLKLHAADYKALLVIGADEFSCDWRNRDVNVNYKAGGAGDGDVVSLELKGN